MRGHRLRLALGLSLLCGACGLDSPSFNLNVVAGDLTAVERALDNGQDPNAMSEGLRPLNDAATSGSTEMVELLLRHGADPRLMGEDHFSALDSAALSGWVPVAQVLIQAGADPCNVSTDRRLRGLPSAVAQQAEEVEIGQRRKETVAYLQDVERDRCH